MRLRLLWLLLTLPLFFSCYAETDTSVEPMADLETKLKSLVSKYYDDYQLCEVFSKTDNKRQFFESALGPALVVGAEQVDSRELFVKELTATVSAHIGFAVFRYKDTEDAKQAMEKIKPEGFLQGTEILTSYRLANHGDMNVLVYSESAADELIEGFMKSLAF